MLFIAEAYTGTVLRGFEGELAAVVSLGFFIPLLIGTGGNIGSQTVTLIVRAMAIGEVTLRDLGWIVFKELRVGLIMGGVMGLVGFALAVPARRGLGRRPGGGTHHRRDLAPGPPSWPRSCRWWSVASGWIRPLSRRR